MSSENLPKKHPLTLNHYKKRALELTQLKTYSNPKRDAWNFDNTVALGQQRQTMSTAFLVNVPNSSFTLTLAKSDRFLRNSRALHLDMDIFMYAFLTNGKLLMKVFHMIGKN